MSAKHAKKQDSDHAQKQQGEEKTHGDPLEAAVSSAGEHAAEHERGERNSAHNSAIPDADKGGHARSAAAHLGGPTHDHTKPVGDMRRYEAEREPPQEVIRAGKEYRRQ